MKNVLDAIANLAVRVDKIDAKVDAHRAESEAHRLETQAHRGETAKGFADIDAELACTASSRTRSSSSGRTSTR